MSGLQIDFRRYLPFWEKLLPEQQAVLTRNVRSRSYKKGTMLHRGSHDCIGLLLVVSGQLRVYVITDSGKELTLYRLFAKEVCLLSASCIMHNIQFDVLVSAEQDTEVLHVPSDVYRRLMEVSAPVSNYTNELMSSRFSTVMWLMDQMLSKRLDTRFAAFLVQESSLTGSDELDVTHEQMANHLGSVREVVTRMLNYFQSEGLVKLGRGKIFLTDRKRLEILAETNQK
ncbi:MAG: Crp/Fnr family transcriptional regulator [Sphaerochaetaceae bacterium]